MMPIEAETLSGLARDVTPPPAPALRPSPVARSQAVLDKSDTLSETVAKRREAEAGALDAERVKMGGLGAEHAARRADMKPGPLKLPGTPEAGARAFLQPGESILGQMQTIILGIGQMATQAKGLKGSAVGALSAMRGLAQGWAEGDAERVQRDYAQWDASVKKLVAEHRAIREKYQDMLTDDKLTMEQRMSNVRLLAAVNGHTALADEARMGNLQGQLDQVRHGENMELKIEHERATVARWYASERQKATTQRLANLDPAVRHYLNDVLRVDPAEATDEAIAKAVAGVEAERLAVEARARTEKQEDRADDRAAREDLKHRMVDLQMMRGGPWVDKASGKVVDNLTRGEWEQGGGHGAYKVITKNQMQTMDLLEAEAVPQIDQLKEIGKRILARHKGQNLGKLLELTAQGKLSDPDVREYQQARNAVSMTLSRALGGSSAIRQFIFKALEEAEVPGLGERQVTLDRMAENSRTAIMNFSRGVKGWKPFAMPSTARTVEAINDAGAVAQIKLAPYEPLPAGWQYRY